MADKVPGKAWVVVFAGMAVNLCLGILYAWSVWAKALINVDKAGQPFPADSINAGWTYLTQRGSGHALFFVRPYFCLIYDSRRPYPG